VSYDVSLEKDGKVVEIDRHFEGGIICLQGSDTAELNITYNYYYFFNKSLSRNKGIRWLYGKKAKDTIKRLEKAVKELGTRQDSDYWKLTPGNAGHALSILLEWAKQHPEAIWIGD